LINLKEHVPCPSLKVYFVIVEKFIVPDYRPIVVVYYLSNLGYRVRLVGVLCCRYILERCVNNVERDCVQTVSYKMLRGKLSL
jgi:hypothetical protein